MFDNLGQNNKFQQYNQQYDPQSKAPFPQQYQPANHINQNQQNQMDQQQQQQQQYNNYNQQYNQMQQQPQQYYQNQDDSLSQFQQQQEQQYRQQSRQGSQQQQQYPYNQQPQQQYQNMQQPQQQQFQQDQYSNQLGKFQQPPEYQNKSSVDEEYRNKYGGYYQKQLDDQKQYENQYIQDTNNIQPRTRTERKAIKDKDTVEKTRINQRVGYEARNVNMRDLISNPEKDSCLYIPENQRFDKDYAVYDKQQRENDWMKREQILEQRRVQGLEREARRWDQIENQQLFEQQKREYQAKVLLAGKRNLNGLPYNPITLQYDNSDQGQKLKARDDDAKVRAYVRSQNLDSRSNSGFNILTGENRQGIERLVPTHLMNDYSNKVEQQKQHYEVKWIPEEQPY